MKLRQLDLFGLTRQHVYIAPRAVKHTLIEKLYDVFISLLAGAHKLVEINRWLRANPALLTAFDLQQCAEPLVVKETLDSYTAEKVRQMEQVLDIMYRRLSQGYQHTYTQKYQLLDVGMSGMPCGKKAAFDSLGYFAKQRNRCGRQFGRLLASRYEEVVIDWLFDGTMQLSKTLQPPMQAAEQILELDECKQERTLVRLDAGCGSVDDVNWLLARDYQVHGKDYSSHRAYCLPGWVYLPASEYVHSVRRMTVRCRKANGQWGIGLLISTFSPVEVLTPTQVTTGPDADPAAVLLVYVYLYDQCAGGADTSFKGDNQGFGSTTRSKKHFEEQQMVILLGNLMIWARKRLAQAIAPSQLRHYSIPRMVHEAFQVTGFLVLDASCHII